MKTSILTASLLMSLLSPFATQASAPAAQLAEFHCENNWYRESVMEANFSTLTIGDSYVAGQDQVKAAIEKSLGSVRLGWIQNIAILIDKNDLTCDTLFPFAPNCTGASKRGAIKIEAQLSGPLGGIVSWTIPVQIAKFSLNSQPSSRGSVTLNPNQPTIVKLDQVNVQAEADVILNGEPVSLKVETFFIAKSKEDSYGAHCEKR